MKLSPAQQEVVDLLRASGEPLERRRGGFWSTPSTPPGPFTAPAWYAGTQTVQSLVKKGVLAEDGAWWRMRLVEVA